NNRRKNASTGQWEDEPVFLDIEAFNRGETGRLADLVEQYLRKGNLAYVEGHLQLDQWTAQDGQKRSKLKIVVEQVQFLTPRTETGANEGASRFQRGTASSPMPVGAPASGSDFGDAHAEPEPFAAADRGDETIPF